MSLASSNFDINEFGIHARQADSCGGDASLRLCGNDRPSNWCCPKNSQCLDINNIGTQAVLCCPAGITCSTIQTIPCDINFQDASKYPGSALHIANLTVALPSCGSSCCPLGFECQIGSTSSTNYCRAFGSTLQTQYSSSSPSSSSTTLSTLSQGVATITPTIGTKPNASSVAASASKSGSTSDGPSAGIIAAIVIPILLGVIALLFATWWFSKKGKHNRKISEPIYDPQMSARTDFLGRRSPELSLTNRISSISGTVLGSGTSHSISPLAPSVDNFSAFPVYHLAPPRPLPKAPQTSSPDLTGWRRGPMANQPPDHSLYYTTPTREVPPMAGTMSSQPKLHILPNTRYYSSAD